MVLSDDNFSRSYNLPMFKRIVKECVLNRNFSLQLLLEVAFNPIVGGRLSVLNNSIACVLGIKLGIRA